MPQDSAAKPIYDAFRKLGVTKNNPSKPDPKPSSPPDTSWHDQQVKEANEAFRKQAEEQQKKATQPANIPAKTPSKVPSYKKGGKVRTTGLALVHKGERVIPKSKVKKVEKAMRKR